MLVAELAVYTVASHRFVKPRVVKPGAAFLSKLARDLDPRPDQWLLKEMAVARDLKDLQLQQILPTQGEPISMCPCFLEGKQSIVNSEDGVISMRRRCE